MKIYLLENWQFQYKSILPLLDLPERLTIWQNLKLKAIQKSQFSKFLVN